MDWNIWDKALARRLRDLVKSSIQRHRSAWLVFAVLLVAGTVAFFASRDDRGPSARLTADAWYYHAYLPSLLLDGDLDFQNEYRITNNWYRFGTAPTGRPKNVFGIGPAVFEAPFFGVGHLLARAGGATADGFSAPEVKASLYPSFLFSLLSLVFVYRLLRRRLGDARVALLSPVLIGLAGPIVYYAIRQPGYAHPFATFFTAWLVDVWDASFGETPRARSLRTWIAMGALLGAATLARPQLAVWSVVYIVAAVDDLRSGEAWPRVVGRWLAGAAVSLLIFLPQLLAWQAIYGSYFLTPQGPGFMRWDAPLWAETLFSSRNGLFPWAPLYALAAVGLVAAIPRHRRLASALLAGVALQTVINGAVWDWWAGGSFGGRRFDSCFVAFAFGLGFVVHAAATVRARVARRILAFIAVAIGVLLAAGNVVLASRTAAHSARIYGGEPASAVLRRRIPRPLGSFVALASSAANFPARAAFALRYGAPLSAYDYVVGVHALHELYPGLNSIPPKRVDKLQFPSARAPNLIGFVESPAGSAMKNEEARILVGLNRRSPPVHAVLHLSVPEDVPGRVRVAWNDEVLAEVEDVAGPRAIQVELSNLQRGTNKLDLLAPAGTVVREMLLSVPTADP